MIAFHGKEEIKDKYLAVAGTASAAIGTVEIIGCIVGPWGFLLARPVMWARPVPIRGRLHFWEFPDEMLSVKEAGR